MFPINFYKELYFHTPSHNFWPVYDAIKKYYPIGLKRTDNSVFFAYPGWKELGDIVADAIHGEDNEKFKTWQAFENKIALAFDVKAQGTTMGQAPSYSTEFILEDEETSELRRVKKIVLVFSLVGKFFAVFGLDETYIIDRANERTQWQNHAINVLTVSPVAEFEKIFNGIKLAVEQQFEGYKFIPFKIHSAVIHGLQVRYSDREECTIFHALFNDKHNFDHIIMPRGDAGFGSNDWEVENATSFEVKMLVQPPPPPLSSS